MHKLTKILALVLLGSSAALIGACGTDNANSGGSTGAKDNVPGNANDVRPLLPGMKAPAFTITDAAGVPFEFDPDNLKNRTVVTFYRGGWCPYCERYLSRLRAAEPDLIFLGYDLLYLSADRHELLKPSLQETEYQYKVLSDNDLTAAKAFGVAFRLDDELFQKYVDNGHDLEGASGRTHHMLPAPATFVIGTDGIIRFQYVNPNYKIRLDPNILFQAAESLYLEETGEQ